MKDQFISPQKLGVSMTHDTFKASNLDTSLVLEQITRMKSSYTNF